MLKSIDVLIGLSTIMLLGSMIVMAVTHFVMMLVNARGKHLRTGLIELLRQLDPRLGQDVVQRIIDKVLTFPQLQTATGRLGGVVQQSQFISLLLELAVPDNGGQGAARVPSAIQLAAGDRNALRAFLRDNGIAQPEQTLDRIRDLTLQIERSNPELTAELRQRIAILQEAESRFLSGVHAWFDQAIDRVSERFTAYTRVVTYTVAVIVVLMLQLDVIAIVNRLYLDEAARKAFVERVAPAAAELQRQSATLPAAPDANAAKTAEDVKAQAQRLQDQLGNISGALATEQMVTLPGLDWRPWNIRWSFSKVVGMFLAVILLGLGAPFWYKALGTLLQFRSIATRKDDAQRAARSTPPAEPTVAGATASAGAAPPSAMPQWLRGEQGDLALIG